jgi:glycosyltransferase involved in cell wall biosynthesis
MMRPLVSIVVPSFNQGRFLRETLDSIVTQDYRPLEIVVMDGGSTDESVDVLRSYGNLPELRWRSERDKGVVDAVNKGLREARGAIIAIQSSDDLYVPGAIAAAVEALERDASLGLVYGDIEHIDEQSRVTGRSHLPPFAFHEYLGKLTYIPQPAAFFRREAYEATGSWRDDVSYAADAEFYLRIATKFRVQKIDRVLARYRYHDQQRDTASPKIIRDWSKVAAEWTSHADPMLRRHARSGTWLVRYRYTPEHEWLARTWALYRAALANPALLRQAEIRAAKEWFPARYPIWRFLSRVKRMLT